MKPIERDAFARGMLLGLALWVLWAFAWFHLNPPCPDPSVHAKPAASEAAR